MHTKLHYGGAGAEDKFDGRGQEKPDLGPVIDLLHQTEHLHRHLQGTRSCDLFCGVFIWHQEEELEEVEER